MVLISICKTGIETLFIHSYQKYILTYFFVVDDCRFIEVSHNHNQNNGSKENSGFNPKSGSIGLYERTDDRASDPTKSTTWKHTNEDRIIYNAEIRIAPPSGVGFRPTKRYIWRLGKMAYQNTRNYYYTGTYC